MRRLMQQMGLQALYPQRHTTVTQPGHQVYPYWLRGVAVTHPNQVWSSDITYLPLPDGFMFLVVVLDWFSRCVLSWRLSNTLDGAFCREALQAALPYGPPSSFNTDQGTQFTAQAFTAILTAAQVQISMAGRGRAFDNIFNERLWRTVKYEDVYLNHYADVPALEQGLTRYFHFYNDERPHQSLAY